MANSYDAEAAAPAAEGEGAGKISQAEANYRMGGPLVNCGLCANFGGSWGPAAFTCRVVEGRISGYGLSTRYERQDNPFLAGTQSSFDGAQDEGFDAGSAEPVAEQPIEGPEPPRLQIGNRSY